jgi:hypothetical protein
MQALKRRETARLIKSLFERQIYRIDLDLHQGFYKAHDLSLSTTCRIQPKTRSEPGFFGTLSKRFTIVPGLQYKRRSFNGRLRDAEVNQGENADIDCLTLYAIFGSILDIVDKSFSPSHPEPQPFRCMIVAAA